MTWFEWAEKHAAEWKEQQNAQKSEFTPRAWQALALGCNEADKLNHYFLGAEHLLLGIIKLNQGVGITVLQKMGIDVEKLRSEVEKNAPAFPPDSSFHGVPYTPRAKRVIALAKEQAKLLGQASVGTEHVLLGLLIDGGGVAAKALKHFNVDLERTRKEILIELGPNFSPPDDGQKAKD